MLGGGGSGGWPSRRAVGGDFQNRALREEAAARAIGRQCDTSNVRPADAGDAVMPREFFVQHREVGADEVRGIEVFFQQLAEIGARLGDHRVLQILAELGVEFLVGVVRADGAQLQPLVEEILDEALRFRVREQAFDFAAEHAGLVQSAGGSELREPRVGRGVPQEIREPRGEGVVAERGRAGLFCGAVFNVKKEVRRAERGAIRPAHRGLETVARFESRLDARDVFAAHFIGDRAAKGARQKVREQPVGVHERRVAFHGPQAL